jgi:DNA-binding HxlR family transcriptional regulator
MTGHFSSGLERPRELIRPRYTCVPNCAWHARTGKVGRCRAREKGLRGEFEKLSHLEGFAGGTDVMKMMQRSKMGPPIFIGRWRPKFLFSLKRRPYRHGQLRRLGSVSQRMLTRNLRNLESTGLVARRVTRSRTIAVEYSLTQLGRILVVPLGGMCRWTKRHRRRVSAEVRLSGPYPSNEQEETKRAR